MLYHSKTHLCLSRGPRACRRTHSCERSVFVVILAPTPSLIYVLLDFPPHQVGEPAAVTEEKYTHFKNAKGADIEKLMKALFNGLERLGKEKDTNAMVVIMIAEGLLSVGTFMWKAYTTVPWGGSLTVWLGSVITSAGGVAVVGPAIALIVLSFAILWLLLKGCLSSSPPCYTR